MGSMDERMTGLYLYISCGGPFTLTLRVTASVFLYDCFIYQNGFLRFHTQSRKSGVGIRDMMVGVLRCSSRMLR